MPKERIQKLLAAVGVASRRKIEELIRQERITVNGKIAHIGEQISSHDHVKIDNKTVNLSQVNKQQIKVLLYHKPIGEICSQTSEGGRPTVFQSLPKLTNERWIMVGRLDLNTSGLLLFTNDGQLARNLAHPSSNIEREYLVRVYGQAYPDIIKKLLHGVKLEDGMAKFDKIDAARAGAQNNWFKVVVKAGRNRLVRRLWESQGLRVNRLMRIRFGNIILPKSLQPGKFVYLNAADVMKACNIQR